MVFYICCHCYRGQRYCSSRCREKSRRLQCREANRRYEQSLGLEGREDHRARQCQYRQRRKSRVTDQSSPRSSACANLPAPPAPEPTPKAPETDGPPSRCTLNSRSASLFVDTFSSFYWGGHGRTLWSRVSYAQRREYLLPCTLFTTTPGSIAYSLYVRQVHCEYEHCEQQGTR